MTYKIKYKNTLGVEKSANIDAETESGAVKNFMLDYPPGYDVISVETKKKPGPGPGTDKSKYKNNGQNKKGYQSPTRKNGKNVGLYVPESDLIKLGGTLEAGKVKVREAGKTMVDNMLKEI